MKIHVMQNLLEANSKKAESLRKVLLQHKILMINLISSPGSGKTSLLEKTLPILNKHFRIAVIEGDVETDRDAKRLENYQVPVALINTSGACHLESVSIEKALSSFDLDQLDLIFVENVGNLVCPAEFDVGEDMKVALLSVPEGDDKVIKYPLLFRESSLVVLNKVDLLPYSRFNRDSFYRDLSALNANIPVIEMSCQESLGIDSWIQWLEKQIARKKSLQPISQKESIYE